MSSYPAEEYSPQEQDRLAQFRSKVTDLNLSEEDLVDAQLIRWLRARNLNVNKALKMLKASLEWRKENQMDGILEREKIAKEYYEKCPTAYLGVDRDGYPIFLTPMGRYDTRTVLETLGPDTCFRYYLINVEKHLEVCRNVSKEQGRTVTRCVEIVDAQGFNYRQFASKLCLNFMGRTQKAVDPNYPEMLHSAIVINAPKVFHVFFNLIKSFIPKQTLEKVQIFGPDPEKWKQAIGDRFPLELIPTHWGGTREGSDEFCSQEDIWVHGPVPYTFFTDGAPSSAIAENDDANVTTATINEGDTLEISLDVTKKDSCILWRYRVQSDDIGFKIVYENGDAIVSLIQVQSQEQYEDGIHPCSELGIYTVVFDNSSCPDKSKTVMYSVSVYEPEKEDNELEESTPNS